MTAGQINAILNDEPFLTAVGIQIFRRMTDINHEKFREARERLETSVDECTRAERWLTYIEPTKSIGRRSSYSLKHLAEKATGDYVSAGALIVAALHRGFRYEQAADNVNVSFNISERSIKAAPIRITTRADGTVIEIRPVKAAAR